ncbi:hypothetical protein D3C84_1186410 [compost metagenome]
MGTEPCVSAAEQVQCVTSMDASVGPYRLCKAIAVDGVKVSKKAFTVPARNASPLQNTRRNGLASDKSGSSRKRSSMEGTK